MNNPSLILGRIAGALALFASLLTNLAAGNPIDRHDSNNGDDFDRRIVQNNADQLRTGRQIFSFDTFGNEVFWGDTLKLYQAIAGAANGGVGGGLSPQAALAAGLKVDREALPPSPKNQLRQGKVNLSDPATSIALLKLDAVVGYRPGLCHPLECARCESGTESGNRRTGHLLRPAAR